jgi:hypothetical protein
MADRDELVHPPGEQHPAPSCCGLGEGVTDHRLLITYPSVACGYGPTVWLRLASGYQVLLVLRVALGYAQCEVATGYAQRRGVLPLQRPTMGGAYGAKHACRETVGFELEGNSVQGVATSFVNWWRRSSRGYQCQMHHPAPPNAPAPAAGCVFAAPVVWLRCHGTARPGDRCGGAARPPGPWRRARPPG